MINNFDLNDDMLHIIGKYTDKGNNRDVIFLLEQYHVYSRKRIIEILNSLTPVFHDVRTVNRENRTSELDYIEKTYDVLTEFVDDTTVNIIFDPYTDIDLDMLESNLFSFDNINYVGVTPLNYLELIDSVPEIDYRILCQVVVAECKRLKGSDIHITCGYSNMVPHYWVDYRIDNRIVRADTVPFTRDMNKKFIFSMVSKLTNSNHNDIEISGIHTRIDDPIGNGKYVLRLTTSKVICGYHCVIRIQDLKTVSLQIDQLGFDDKATTTLKTLTKKSSGLTLITGPIRSGKNTTAFALANSYLRQPLRLIDYSSPVETLMDFPQSDYSDNIEVLISCIKNCKKQDTDIAFINEIPSSDVAFAVRDLVNSSVGVITTMHVERIWHLPNKLHDYYGEGYKDLISQINAVCNQKMLVKQCPHCQEMKSVKTLDDTLANMLLQYGVETYYDNRGCDKCIDGNLPGEVQPYVEILRFTEQIKQDLLKCEHPYEMVTYLYELVHKEKCCLEYKLADGIRLGKIVAESLYTII